MKLRVDRRFFRTAAILLAVPALFLAGAVLLSLWEEGGLRDRESAGPTAPPEEESGELLYYEGRWYAPREDIETVLLLGLDRSQQEGIGMTGEYAQSDFILLLGIDRTSEVCRPIFLNRDTMAQLQDFDQYGRPSGTYTAQLALAYAHAQAYTGNDRTACQTAVDAVSGLLYGVEIDHYVTLTMDGLMVLNDLAGGVTVEIRDDFSAVDETLVRGETVKLLGEHALNYVRARWYVGESTNLERMERQREYLKALQEQLAGRDEEFVLDSLLKVNEYMASDCTAEQLAGLAGVLRTFQMEEFITLDGEMVQQGEYMEFYVDEEALKGLVVEMFYVPLEDG